MRETWKCLPAIDLLLRLHRASDEARYLNAATDAVRRLSGQFQNRPEAWASAIAALNRHPLRSTPESGAIANTVTSKNAPQDFGVPASADHIHVAGSAMSVPEGDAIVVTVTIDDKFHINANPVQF